MNHIPWSEEEEKLLKKLWANPDLTITEVAKAFTQRTRGAVHCKAKNLGLVKATRKPEIDYEYLKKLGVVIEI